MVHSVKAVGTGSGPEAPGKQQGRCQGLGSLAQWGPAWEEGCGSWSEKAAERGWGEGRLPGEEGTSAVAGRTQGAGGGSWSPSVKDAEGGTQCCVRGSGGGESTDTFFAAGTRQATVEKGLYNRTYDTLFTYDTRLFPSLSFKK